MTGIPADQSGLTHRQPPLPQLLASHLIRPRTAGDEAISRWPIAVCQEGTADSRQTGMGSGGIFEEKMFVSIRTAGEETGSEREIGCEIVVKVGVVEELFQEKKKQ